jgi:hypothetical protein
MAARACSGRVRRHRECVLRLRAAGPWSRGRRRSSSATGGRGTSTPSWVCLDPRVLVLEREPVRVDQRELAS